MLYHTQVVLDPPTWTKTKAGAVDLVRDYQALFKPCVLATRPGGTVLAVNHVASVGLDDWCAALARHDPIPLRSPQRALPTSLGGSIVCRGSFACFAGLRFFTSVRRRLMHLLPSSPYSSQRLTSPPPMASTHSVGISTASMTLTHVS